YDGDRMNCGHPMVGEYFRQASVYLFRTFNLDGLRFDPDHRCEVPGRLGVPGNDSPSLRLVASAGGRPWPYCVAENSATNLSDISSPAGEVMDGKWDIEGVYGTRDASYGSGHAGWDDSVPLKAEMDKPQYWGRPFYQATRFGESHDMVSAQDAGNKRIAARPP